MPRRLTLPWTQSESPLSYTTGLASSCHFLCSMEPFFIRNRSNESEDRPGTCSVGWCTCLLRLGALSSIAASTYIRGTGAARLLHKIALACDLRAPANDRSEQQPSILQRLPIAFLFFPIRSPHQ
jgi:hypothetical protein